jgi:hypothetical protein
MVFGDRGEDDVATVLRPGSEDKIWCRWGSAVYNDIPCPMNHVWVRGMMVFMQEFMHVHG